MDRLFYIAFVLILFSCFSPKQKTNNEKDTNDPNEYYSNGNIRIEKIINGNDEHWIFKQEDGGCWEEKFFRNGEEYKKIVYNSDCTKSAEYELKNGYRNGSWKSYHENGKLREEGNYKDGMQEGVFKYYDDSGNMLYTENNFIIDSNHMSFWGFENDYRNFVEYLSNKKIKFEKDDNIEVAGNKQYHFPILRFENSVLYFDMEGPEPVKCEGGELNDCTFQIFDKICPDMADGGLLVLSGAKWEKGMTHINVYNLADETVYHFHLENDQLQSVVFESITRRY